MNVKGDNWNYSLIKNFRADGQTFIKRNQGSTDAFILVSHPILIGYNTLCLCVCPYVLSMCVRMYDQKNVLQNYIIKELQKFWSVSGEVFRKVRNKNQIVNVTFLGEKILTTLIFGSISLNFGICI